MSFGAKGKDLGADRFQAVLEVDVLERKRHCNDVYVTYDATKTALKALHVRCWSEGREDHTELRPATVLHSF